MELREIRSLALLADCHSLKRVAEMVHVSTPSVHKQLKALEAELQVKLYERSGRQLRLTQAATMMLPDLLEMLGRHDAAMFALEEWKGAHSGHVRIGAGPITSTYFLPHVVKQFLDESSGATISLISGGTEVLVDSLRKGTVDVSFVVLQELNESHISIDLLEEVCAVELVLVSGKMLGLPQRCPLKSLENVPFVSYQADIAVSPYIERYLFDVGLRPRVVIRCDRSETIKAMVQEGLGVGILPCWAVEEEVKAGSLHIVRQRERPLMLSIGLARRRSTYVFPALRVFLDIARKCGSALRTAKL